MRRWRPRACRRPGCQHGLVRRIVLVVEQLQHRVVHCRAAAAAKNRALHRACRGADARASCAATTSLSCRRTGQPRARRFVPGARVRRTSGSCPCRAWSQLAAQPLRGRLSGVLGPSEAKLRRRRARGCTSRAAAPRACSAPCGAKTAPRRRRAAVCALKRPHLHVGRETLDSDPRTRGEIHEVRSEGFLLSLPPPVGVQDHQKPFFIYKKHLHHPLFPPVLR